MDDAHCVVQVVGAGTWVVRLDDLSLFLFAGERNVSTWVHLLTVLVESGTWKVFRVWYS